jgi:hypothetical protein
MSRALEENPNCEYTHATFRLVGDALIASTIEARTGITGDFAYERDQVRRSKTGRGIRQPTGVWYITSEGRVGSTNVERHLSYLLEIVEPAKRELLEVAAEQSLRMDFYCYWISATGQGGPGLSAESMKRIADLDATLNFELHGPL